MEDSKNLRLVIAGSRSATDARDLAQGLVGFFSAFKLRTTDIVEYVSGGAKGADQLGEAWATTINAPIKKFIPNWSKGRGAGFARNKEMAQYADCLLLLWDGVSKGSVNMLKNAEEQGLKIYVYRIDNPELSYSFDPAPLL